MPRGKPNTTATSKINKSAWIRSQSASTPAKDLVAQAKKEGIKLSLAQVYTARSTAKNASGPAQLVAPSQPGRPKKAIAAAGSDSHVAFRRLVISIGVDRAELFLAAIKSQSGL
jgi:hypothetical protein